MFRSFIFLALFLVILSGCSGSMTKISEADRLVRMDRQVAGLTQEQIFFGTLEWMEKNFTQSKNPVSIFDLDGGRIVGSGQIDYPCRLLGCINKKGWKVVFDMQVDAGRERLQTTFRRIALTSPPSGQREDSQTGMRSPVWSKADMVSIRPLLEQLNNDLLRSLLQVRN